MQTHCMCPYILTDIPKKKNHKSTPKSPTTVPNNLPAIVPPVSSEPIPTIDALYSPRFPLEVVREFVMEALHEAVQVNQVHNRDPIGGSNENLFL